MEITFEQLPAAIANLFSKVENIERLLLITNTPQPHQADQWFDLSELCSYLPDKPAKATVYGWVHTGLIPSHKGQKKLRFLKSEIDTWLLEGRKKTFSEIAKNADNIIKRKAQ